MECVSQEKQMNPEIQNVVSSINLKNEVNLKKLAMNTQNIEYNPTKWSPAAIMRIKNPKATALVFRSGKLICIGAKSIEESKNAARKFGRRIQKAGFHTTFNDFKIHNIVGNSMVNTKLNLDKIYNEHISQCYYDPRSFPGLTFCLKSPKISILVFQSGKIVLTGAKSISDINLAYHKIVPLLKVGAK